MRFVLEGLDKPGHYAYLSTIDFTKAFDRVNHNIVVKKLIELGVRRSIIPIICSFLTGRTQTTKIGKHTSPPLSTTCGVPQGTKLGPILFLILVNDALSSYENKWKYVDDLTIGEVVKRNQLTTLQNTLDNLSVWCQQNDVLPKPAKCNLMRVCFLRNMEPPTNFILNNVQLYVVPHLKLLGITIQDDLKWDIHVENTVSKASRKLYTLCILKKCKTPIEDMVIVFCCYIRPVLEYACPVWHTSLTEAQANKLEFVQKRALRIIMGRDYTGYDEALKVCKLPSLSSRRDTLLENFGIKMFHSVKHRHLLPPTKASTSSRQLRDMSGLCTIRCHTERYRKSTIPFLARNLKV